MGEIQRIGPEVQRILEEARSRADDPIEKLLIDAGTLVAKPERLAALVRQIHEWGFVEANVAVVLDYLRGTGARSVGGALVDVFSTSANAIEVVARCEKWAASRKRRDYQPGENDRLKGPAPLPGDDKEKWAYDRTLRVIFGRVVADRRSIQEVANETGLSCAEVIARLEVAKVMRAEEVAAVKADIERMRSKTTFAWVGEPRER